MASMEGHPSAGRYNATFFSTVTATAAWVKVTFTDHLSDQFESRHILLICDAQSAYFSCDPRGLPATAKSIQGVIASGESIELLDRHACEIYIQRTGGTNATVRVYAWR